MKIQNLALKFNENYEIYIKTKFKFHLTSSPKKKM